MSSIISGKHRYYYNTIKTAQAKVTLYVLIFL